MAQQAAHTKAVVSAPAGWSPQRGTLARELRLSGRGLHTGHKANIRILPIPPGAPPQGIVFRRMQGGEIRAELPVRPDVWREYPLCSTLEEKSGARVKTVEHLLAALLMCEIDETVVELDAEEVPFLDGGALAWIKALQGCGRLVLPRPKRFIKILEKFEISAGKDGHYVLEPAQACFVDVSMQERGFAPMRWEGEMTPEVFAREIAPARSFGNIKWAIPALIGGFLTGKPLIRGARPSNVAALLAGRVLGGMRLPDELARHRVLDLLGDFALAGVPILGRINAARPNHYRNHKVISRLLASSKSWVWAEAE